jgi:hypothetical protein
MGADGSIGQMKQDKRAYDRRGFMGRSQRDICQTFESQRLPLADSKSTTGKYGMLFVTQDTVVPQVLGEKELVPAVMCRQNSSRVWRRGSIAWEGHGR